jgi:hypothetical protein
MDPARDMTTEQACRSLRPGLTLAASWRVLTELWRRHCGGHDLRLLHTHPGASERGQLCMLVDPLAGQVMDCTRLVLNLGGPSGTYEVHAKGRRVAEGQYLWPTLTDDPAQVVDSLERQLGLRAPAALPASTPPVLVMRLVGELLTATCLDRDGLAVEAAWMDWSGGVSVQPWVVFFGRDAKDIQQRVDSGQLDWQRAYLDVSPLLRIAQSTGEATAPTECLMDMQAGQVLVQRHGKTTETVDLVQAYAAAGRRLEPLAARLLAALRGGK